MKIKFLGSGSAFNTDNFQSNILIEKNGKRLLVDCGADLKMSLAWDIQEVNQKQMILNRTGISSKDIDAIYISHLHSDHANGMEYCAFTSYPWGGHKHREPIKLFGEGNLLDDLWNMTLRGGLKSIQGKRVTLTDYFEVHPIQRNGHFIWQDTKFNIVQVCHVVDEYSIVNSYGLMFKGDTGKNVFITTDTQFCPYQMITFYAQADIIFHDAETTPFKSGVHSHYTDLNTLHKETKAKMHLYHYQDGEKPDCIKDGFRGWVKQGQILDL